MEELPLIIGVAILAMVLVAGVTVKLITKRMLRRMDGCGKVTEKSDRDETLLGKR